MVVKEVFPGSDVNDDISLERKSLSVADNQTLIVYLPGWLKTTFKTTWRKKALFVGFGSDIADRYVRHRGHASAGQGWRGRPSVKGMYLYIHLL
jgi:hypothetical protein